MSTPGSLSELLIGAAGAAGGGYQIERSLRFNSSDSAFCGRSFTSAGNRTTWSLSFWYKRSTLGTNQCLFIASDFATTTTTAYVTPSDTIEFYDYQSSAYSTRLVTAQVFRDTSAWYHLVFVWDTNNGTSADRARIYVNGSRVSTFTISTYPGSGTQSRWNNNVAHEIGKENTSNYLNGYLADVHFIDGQALTPSSFTEVSATTGQLIPKAYSGSFGTNGFWLKFSDNSAATATTLGKDYSGNNNNWSPSNLSVTAGAGNDSLVDTPTSYGTDTGAGGEVRGNYATLNPLKLGSSLSLANGNLDVSASGSSITSQAFSTIAVNSGLWYFEVTVSTNTNANATIGVATPQASQATYAGQDANSWGFGPYSGSYYLYVNGVQINSSAPGLSQTGTFGFAFDASSGKFWATDQAGTWLASGNPATGANPLISSITTTNGLLASVGHYSVGSQTTAQSVNFGQRSFAYTAPSGFKALCDTNLPAPVVAQPSTVMDVALYTGNGSTQTISGFNFEPDFVWLKGRSVAYSHQLYDQIRGAGKLLGSNTTNAETTVTDNLTAFTSSGFTLGNDAGTNQSSATYVAWTWDAGSSTVTNTQGSITSSCRTNQSSGFSVLTYTGNGSTGSVGHGLNVAPQFIVYKIRNGSSSWQVYHASLGATKYLNLDTTDAVQTSNTRWNDTAPSSTVVSLGTNGANSFDYVMYAWAPVAGYSSFGSYTGNGSTDGPFVYTGFRPRYVLQKKTSDVSAWSIRDAARDPYNAANTRLWTNFSSAESSADAIDILSNGFKVRNTDTDWNANGATYIYAAFAENPFQYARAR